MKPLRAAFLTPEFTTEDSRFGGIAAYVYRITKALKQMGHEPEIFTLSQRTPQVLNFEGIRVQRVRPYQPIHFRLIYRVIAKISRRLFHCDLKNTYMNIALAWGMARALKGRENGQQFDFVHSSDYRVPGLFVRKNGRRPLMVRSSWARDLCLKAEGVCPDMDSRMVGFLENMIIRRANIAYAPSRFVAAYHNRRNGSRVSTLRPPFVQDAAPSARISKALPQRYLFHFATALGPLKGTDILADALPRVWKQEPDFAMVWAGRERRQYPFTKYSARWGKYKNQVTLLGKIEKSELYAVLKAADATVLPSRYDNLPNTAIESLAFGVPVIGPNGASFDEFIEPGLNGELFKPGDTAALAQILIQVWRRQVPWLGNGYHRPAIFDEMESHVAADNLIRLAGIAS